MAVASGWLALALVVLAAGVPLGYRLRAGRRGAPRSRPIEIHVMIGVATAAAAFGHSLFGVLSLGSASAIGASRVALFAGGAALLVLIAHAGVGLQLRDPKLRRRAEKRRTHAATAITVAVCAAVHTALLWSAAP